jgi:2-methylfumaryl-CoA hydratase
MIEAKTATGNFFEDFHVGQLIRHATPRTITSGDVALYTGLYGSRFVVQSSDAFARGIGYRQSPIDDLLVFHVVFGTTVPDISLNAVANLGYAECRFPTAVYAGDTLSASTEVIGLKENSSGETGVVYVRSTGVNQRGEPVLTFVRWVMVRKRDRQSSAPAASVPKLADRVDPAMLGTAVPALSARLWSNELSGSRFRWADYAAGERIDHGDGTTIEEAEHQIATRLYQNTAKVHFNQHSEGQGRFGRRLVYGGVIMSIVRALSFNGLGNAFHIAAINGGRHVAPAFADDTIYAWSEVLERVELAGRTDVGAVRLRTVGLKNRTAATYALKSATADGHDEGVILDLDIWAVLPR